MTTIPEHHRLIPLYAISGDYGRYLSLTATSGEAADSMASSGSAYRVTKFWLELDTEGNPVAVHEERPEFDDCALCDAQA